MSVRQVTCLPPSPLGDAYYEAAVDDRGFGEEARLDAVEANIHMICWPRCWARSIERSCRREEVEAMLLALLLLAGIALWATGHLLVR
jgi:hypothetical protein